MKYNFDESIDRTNSHSVKLERLKPVFGSDKLIPLWVADMDFKSPPPIIEALRQRVEHGVFGYTVSPEAYTNSIIRWLDRRHHWQVEKEQISFVPGVVKGLAFAIDLFTGKGDKIIIQPPVYHPFRLVPQSLGRELVNNPLLLEEGQYRMDFTGLREIIAHNDCKMLILCNPHNPGGRAWSPDELKELAEICYDNRILVVSDEIHSDMAMPGFRHTPFASVSEKAQANSLTLMAPSKTFNIAGIVSSFVVIPDKKLRDQFLGYLEPRELSQGTIFAYTATTAAYDECEEWLDEMVDYVQGNVDFVHNYLKENIPQIQAMLPEASFLVWLDCRDLHLSQPDLVRLFVDRAGLALNDGSMFGSGGEGFMRLNVGTTRKVLEQALNNLKKALSD